MDGLRAVACLTVFLANFHHSMGMTVSGHAGPLDAAYFAESGIGVVLLIVMSGALLSVPFWQRLARGDDRPVWREFARRRAVRIAPPYYACLAALILARAASPFSADTISHFLFVNNLRDSSFYSISPQFWTIGMFVQFYCALPLVFLALRGLKLRGGAAAGGVAAMAFAAYGLHWALMTTRERWAVGPVAVFASPDGFAISHSALAHLPQFLFGVLIGHAMWRAADGRGGGATRLQWEATFWVSALGLLLMAAVPALERLQWPYGRYLFPWMPAFAAAVILAAPFAPVGRGLLELAPLRWLGIVSYGIYIYQMACMTAVHRLLAGATYDSPAAKARFAALSLGLTVLVATCSYLALERPLRRWSARSRLHERVVRPAANRALP